MKSNLITKFSAFIIFSLITFVPIALFLEYTPIYIAWIILWICSFEILFSSYSLETRGLLFISSSLAIGLIALAYAEKTAPEWLWAVNYVSQIMIIAGGAVGGNFLAHGIMKRQ